MKKLSDIQMFRLDEAHRHASAVLIDLRSRPLKGADLERMKALEAAVQNLEALRIA